jgi:hypothetical protein
VNPRTRRAALYAIGAIAILASANALTHGYAGLYDWAVHHRLSGWHLAAARRPQSSGLDADGGEAGQVLADPGVPRLAAPVG